MPSACLTLARALLFAPVLSLSPHCDVDPYTGRWSSVGSCEATQASMSYKTGQGTKLPVPLFCHPQPCKMEQFTPSSAGCSLQCSQALQGEGGAPPEASCCCPQGTKVSGASDLWLCPSEGHRFVHIGMSLRHLQEDEQETREPTGTFV